EEERDLPPAPEVLITAHGISNRERERLQSQGKRLIDTTCPLVRRVHKSALRLARLGYFVVVVGRHEHVEVEGLIGDLEDYVVVSSVQEVACWNRRKIGVINQTTTRPELLQRIHATICQRNPEAEIELVDTICSPTRDRQQAVRELLDRVEALVVVGGANSNNTRELGQMAERAQKPWLHIQQADQLRPEWFTGFRLVGLTAGTSTPDSVIDEVHRRLITIAAASKISA
ncbi:MAG: 4-hydroxy-3-methylbut-2-enyl diphosphate reductase, partial [Candidatus Eremiobacteraeota bacterium]|nr:4-hydroxy-3-methylbut-2-enyl diphosphate reductase [Candidatus Eremiobacteraeota bacterium]